MKTIYIFLLLGFIISSSYAQTPPVAVNDTFYVNYETPRNVTRNNIIANDSDIDGNVLIVDTIIYNGSNQIVPTYYPNNYWLRLNKFAFTPQSGFFGLDSVKYALTDNGSPTGFDTATIYFHVRRKEYENLDLNNVNAFIHKEALFNDPLKAIAGFSVPKQNDVNDPYHATIFGANLWVAGKDGNGQVKSYDPTFYGGSAVPPTVNSTLSSAGPISDSWDEEYSYQWDRVWKVSQAEIDDHIANYYLPGYQMPEAIANWPGNGLGSGQASILAPFYDVDGDGVYNPEHGEYPIIKGQQAVYFINNDSRTRDVSYGNPMQLEVHGMAYAYDCPSDSAINNTIFVDYKIYNRSSVTYEDVYTGFWADFDLGNPGDDYLGCDVSRGAFYAYNGDGNDENSIGVLGYGTYPPAQSVVFLKGPQQEADGIDNPLTTDIQNAIDSVGIPYAGLGVGYGDGVVDNEYLGLKHFMYYNIGPQINGNGDPQSPSDVHNYLQGLYTDGSPVMTGNVPVDYMFYDDSDPLYWASGGTVVGPFSESSSSNTPGDRRGVGSTGPFTLAAGASVELELALVFGRDYTDPGNNLAGVVVMKERIDSIRSYYLDGFQSVCGGTLSSVKTIDENEETALQVYPNPFNNQFTVFYGLTEKTAQLQVMNLYGEVVVSQIMNQNKTMVDLSGMANGIYFVQITEGQNRVTQKLIKQ